MRPVATITNGVALFFASPSLRSDEMWQLYYSSNPSGQSANSLMKIEKGKIEGERIGVDSLRVDSKPVAGYGSLAMSYISGVINSLCTKSSYASGSIPSPHLGHQ